MVYLRGRKTQISGGRYRLHRPGTGGGRGEGRTTDGRSGAIGPTPTPPTSRFRAFFYPPPRFYLPFLEHNFVPASPGLCRDQLLQVADRILGAGGTVKEKASENPGKASPPPGPQPTPPLQPVPGDTCILLVLSCPDGRCRRLRSWLPEG